MSPIYFRKIAISLAMFAVVALGSAFSAQADPVNFTLTGPDFSGSGNAVAGSITVLISNAGPNTVTVTFPVARGREDTRQHQATASKPVRS